MCVFTYTTAEVCPLFGMNRCVCVGVNDCECVLLLHAYFLFAVFSPTNVSSELDTCPQVVVETDCESCQGNETEFLCVKGHHNQLTRILSAY